MTLVGHASRIGALALALLALLVARADAAAIVAFVPGATLEQLAAQDGASAALLNTSQGAYDRTQFLLDVSQGARTSRSAYQPSAVPALSVTVGGTVVGWDAAVARARAAPATVVPGLLGSSAGGMAYVGPASTRDLAIAAASRDGHVNVVDVGSPTTESAFALSPGATVLTRVADIDDLRALLAERPADLLVLAVAEPPDGTLPGAVLPIAAFGLGEGRSLTSQTTRTDGLVSAIDIGPTLLAWNHRAIPEDMTGEPIRTGGALDVDAITAIRERGAVVKGRRYPTLGALMGAWALLALGAAAVARGRGFRWAVRTGALGFLWVLPLLLVTAAIAPSAPVEVVSVALASLALGALTGALVRWPAGPLVPGAVTIVSYTVDLAFGSPLIVRSLLGSNPLGGSRFYGIGNELESLLPVIALGAVAAGLCLAGAARRSSRMAAAFAIAGVALGFVLGWSRLGSDVGGVVTVGAGFAVATVLALPGRLTWRRVAIAIAVPVAALVALALLDLATGGEGHFSRLVLRSGHGEAFGDALQRRGNLALDNLEAGFMPWLTAVALALIAIGIWRRDRLLAGVPGADAWRAALAGCAAVAIVGALANDSGPLLLVFATFVTLWLAAYLSAGSRTGADRSMV
jgi:hypothetical protein